MQTEEEQIEVMKKWWEENGRSVIAAVLISLAVYVGYNYWVNSRAAEIASASEQYQQILTALEGEQQASEASRKTVAHLTDKLKADFSNSAYASYAALLQAKQSVEANDLDAAEEQLKWVVAQQPEAQVLELAILRTAQVKFAQQKDDEALALINDTDSQVYPARFAELAGDIYLAKEDKAQARLSYTKALQLQTQSGKPANRILKMKADNVAEVSADMLIPTTVGASEKQEG